MQTQNILTKMNLAVDPDTIKTAVLLQIPIEYESIIQTLELRTDTASDDLQSWIDEVSAHIQGTDAKIAIRQGKIEARSKHLA